jgi:DNA-binding response OmpR family regulator
METSVGSTLKKILVVDDDKTVTTTLDGLLSSHGYTVLVAYDGLDGMIQVKKNVPDLIILDIMMPEINGYDVCSNLKFDEKFKHIPIIVLTSREQELDSRVGRLMGIDYMQKPIDSKLLLGKVQHILK